jgi:superfamily I DNA/RNA helicase
METVAVVSLCTTLDESLAARSSAFARGGLQIAGRQTRPGIAQLFTAAEVKGIEFDHVCVTDIDTVEDPIAVARLYVAMSRARVSLWLCYGDRAWREIRNGRKAPKA